MDILSGHQCFGDDSDPSNVFSGDATSIGRLQHLNVSFDRQSAKLALHALAGHVYLAVLARTNADNHYAVLEG
jgi:hypothetical protein